MHNSSVVACMIGICIVGIHIIGVYPTFPSNPASGSTSTPHPVFHIFPQHPYLQCDELYHRHLHRGYSYDR